jgi:hypothetical protein
MKGSRYCLVEADGEIDYTDGKEKLACSKMRIVKELSLPELIEHSTTNRDAITGNSVTQVQLKKGQTDADYQMEPNYSKRIAIFGSVTRQFSQGDNSVQVACGHHSIQNIVGAHSCQLGYGENCHQLAWGYSVNQYATGDDSKQLSDSWAGFQRIDGGNGISINVNDDGKVMLGARGSAVLRWTDKTKRARFTVLYEGENGIEAGVWYKLDDDGQVIMSISEENEK